MVPSGPGNPGKVKILHQPLKHVSILNNQIEVKSEIKKEKITILNNILPNIQPSRYLLFQIF